MVRMQQLLREHVVTYSGIILGMVPLGRIWDVQAIVQLPVTRGRHEAQQEDKLKCLKVASESHYVRFPCYFCKSYPSGSDIYIRINRQKFSVLSS